MRLRKPERDKSGNFRYDPKFPGIHICGIEKNDSLNFIDQPYTILSVRFKNDDECIRIWWILRLEFEVEAKELSENTPVIDLNIGNYSIIDEFSIYESNLERFRDRLVELLKEFDYEYR